MPPPSILVAARAEALFLSDLQPSQSLTRVQVDVAIRVVVRAHQGTRGCAGDVAGEFGDHPEVAAARMRWALRTVQALYVKGACRCVQDKTSAGSNR